MKAGRLDLYEHKLARLTEAEALEALAARKLLSASGVQREAAIEDRTEYFNRRSHAERLRAMVEEPVRAGGAR